MEQSWLFSNGETLQAEISVQDSRTNVWMSTTKFVLIVVIFWVFIFLFGFFVKSRGERLIPHNITSVTLVHYDPHVAFEHILNAPCHVESWNQKNTEDFPYYSLYKYFADRGVTGSEGLSDGELRLLSAFLYEEYIVVTHTAQNPKGVGRTAYCHYYDCNRKELSASRFESFVFPMTAVHCPRRRGAKYMSLSFEKAKLPIEDPIPLINRIFEYPPHEIGVCVGQIYVLAWLLIICVGYFVGAGVDSTYYTDYQIHYDEHVGLEDNSPPRPCFIDDWNRKTTYSFPYFDLYKKFASNKLTAIQGLSDSRLRLLTAFLYEDYIVVTHTAQNPKGVGRTAYCHYYDCNQDHIPGSKFESFVFPMTAVHCPRRAGAKFISLSFSEDDVPQTPIPLLNRIFKNPPNEIGVCVGPIYGDERKWLDIIEYIEHHKLIGASVFYFTILEMDVYTKRAIDHYQQTGDVEATFVNTEYDKVTWLFHMIQVHECFFRSKFHSKWVISTDIDERLVMTRMPLPSYLRQQSSTVCEINFGSRRVPVFDKNPSEYISEQQIIDSLSFLRYNLTSEHHWLGFKLIFQPAKVHTVHFHWTWRQYEGCHVKTAPANVGYIRHYRTTSSKSLRGNWFHLMKPYQISKMDKQFVHGLTENVSEKVKYIYKRHPVYCSSIDPKIRSKFKNDLHCV